MPSRQSKLTRGKNKRKRSSSRWSSEPEIERRNTRNSAHPELESSRRQLEAQRIQLAELRNNVAQLEFMLQAARAELQSTGNRSSEMKQQVIRDQERIAQMLAEMEKLRSEMQTQQTQTQMQSHAPGRKQGGSDAVAPNAGDASGHAPSGRAGADSAADADGANAARDSGRGSESVASQISGGGGVGHAAERDLRRMRSLEEALMVARVRTEGAKDEAQDERRRVQRLQQDNAQLQREMHRLQQQLQQQQRQQVQQQMQDSTSQGELEVLRSANTQLVTMCKKLKRQLEQETKELKERCIYLKEKLKETTNSQDSSQTDNKSTNTEQRKTHGKPRNSQNDKEDFRNGKRKLHSQGKDNSNEEVITSLSYQSPENVAEEDNNETELGDKRRRKDRRSKDSGYSNQHDEARRENLSLGTSGSSTNAHPSDSLRELAKYREMLRMERNLSSLYRKEVVSLREKLNRQSEEQDTLSRDLQRCMRSSSDYDGMSLTTHPNVPQDHAHPKIKEQTVGQYSKQPVTYPTSMTPEQQTYPPAQAQDEVTEKPATLLVIPWFSSQLSAIPQAQSPATTSKTTPTNSLSIVPNEYQQPSEKHSGMSTDQLGINPFSPQSARGIMETSMQLPIPQAQSPTTTSKTTPTNSLSIVQNESQQKDPNRFSWQQPGTNQDTLSNYLSAARLNSAQRRSPSRSLEQLSEKHSGMSTDKLGVNHLPQQSARGIMEKSMQQPNTPIRPCSRGPEQTCWLSSTPSSAQGRGELSKGSCGRVSEQSLGDTQRPCFQPICPSATPSQPRDIIFKQPILEESSDLGLKSTDLKVCPAWQDVMPIDQPPGNYQNLNPNLHQETYSEQPQLASQDSNPEWDHGIPTSLPNEVTWKRPSSHTQSLKTEQQSRQTYQFPQNPDAPWNSQLVSGHPQPGAQTARIVSPQKTRLRHQNKLAERSSARSQDMKPSSILPKDLSQGRQVNRVSKSQDMFSSGSMRKSPGEKAQENKSRRGVSKRSSTQTHEWIPEKFLEQFSDKISKRLSDIFKKEFTREPSAKDRELLRKRASLSIPGPCEQTCLSPKKFPEARSSKKPYGIVPSSSESSRPSSCIGSLPSTSRRSARWKRKGKPPRKQAKKDRHAGPYADRGSSTSQSRSLTPLTRSRSVTPQPRSRSASRQARSRSASQQARSRSTSPLGRCCYVTPQTCCHSLSRQARSRSASRHACSRSACRQARSRSVTPQARIRSASPLECSSCVTSQARSRSVTPEARSRSVTPKARSRSVTPKARSRPVTPLDRSTGGKSSGDASTERKPKKRRAKPPGSKARRRPPPPAPKPCDCPTQRGRPEGIPRQQPVPARAPAPAPVSARAAAPAPAPSSQKLPASPPSSSADGKRKRTPCAGCATAEDCTCSCSSPLVAALSHSRKEKCFSWETCAAAVHSKSKFDVQRLTTTTSLEEEPLAQRKVIPLVPLGEHRCLPSQQPQPLKSPTPPLKSPTPPLKSPTPPSKSPTPPTKSLTPPLKSPTPPLKSPTPQLKSPPLKSPTPQLKSPTPPKPPSKVSAKPLSKSKKKPQTPSPPPSSKSSKTSPWKSLSPSSPTWSTTSLVDACPTPPLYFESQPPIDATPKMDRPEPEQLEDSGQSLDSPRFEQSVVISPPNTPTDDWPVHTGHGRTVTVDVDDQLHAVRRKLSVPHRRRRSSEESESSHASRKTDGEWPQVSGTSSRRSGRSDYSSGSGLSDHHQYADSSQSDEWPPVTDRRLMTTRVTVKQLQLVSPAAERGDSNAPTRVRLGWWMPGYGHYLSPGVYSLRDKPRVRATFQVPITPQVLSFVRRSALRVVVSDAATGQSLGAAAMLPMPPETLQPGRRRRPQPLAPVNAAAGRDACGGGVTGWLRGRWEVQMVPLDDASDLDTDISAKLSAISSPRTPSMGVSTKTAQTYPSSFLASPPPDAASFHIPEGVITALRAIILAVIPDEDHALDDALAYERETPKPDSRNLGKQYVDSKEEADLKKHAADETKNIADETKRVANEWSSLTDETSTDNSETRSQVDETGLRSDESRQADMAKKAFPDENKLLVEKTKVPADETKLPVDKTKVPADEKKLLVDKTKVPADETKLPVDKTKVPADETKLPVDNAKVPADETKLPVDKAKVPADETKLPVDKTKVPADETKVAADERKIADPETKVTEQKHPDRDERRVAQEAMQGVAAEEREAPPWTKNIEKHISAARGSVSSSDSSAYSQTSSGRRKRHPSDPLAATPRVDPLGQRWPSPLQPAGVMRRPEPRTPSPTATTELSPAEGTRGRSASWPLEVSDWKPPWVADDSADVAVTSPEPEPELESAVEEPGTNFTEEAQIDKKDKEEDVVMERGEEKQEKEEGAEGEAGEIDDSSLKQIMGPREKEYPSISEVEIISDQLLAQMVAGIYTADLLPYSTDVEDDEKPIPYRSPSLPDWAPPTTELRTARRRSREVAEERWTQSMLRKRHSSADGAYFPQVPRELLAKPPSQMQQDAPNTSQGAMRRSRENSVDTQSDTPVHTWRRRRPSIDTPHSHLEHKNIPQMKRLTEVAEAPSSSSDSADNFPRAEMPYSSVPSTSAQKYPPEKVSPDARSRHPPLAPQSSSTPAQKTRATYPRTASPESSDESLGSSIFLPVPSSLADWKAPSASTKPTPLSDDDFSVPPEATPRARSPSILKSHVPSKHPAETSKTITANTPHTPTTFPTAADVLSKAFEDEYPPEITPLPSEPTPEKKFPRRSSKEIPDNTLPHSSDEGSNEETKPVESIPSSPSLRHPQLSDRTAREGVGPISTPINGWKNSVPQWMARNHKSESVTPGSTSSYRNVFLSSSLRTIVSASPPDHSELARDSSTHRMVPHYLREHSSTTSLQIKEEPPDVTTLREQAQQRGLPFNEQLQLALEQAGSPPDGENSPPSGIIAMGPTESKDSGLLRVRSKINKELRSSFDSGDDDEISSPQAPSDAKVSEQWSLAPRPSLQLLASHLQAHASGRFEADSQNSLQQPIAGTSRTHSLSISDAISEFDFDRMSLGEELRRIQGKDPGARRRQRPPPPPLGVPLTPRLPAVQPPPTESPGDSPSTPRTPSPMTSPPGSPPGSPPSSSTRPLESPLYPAPTYLPSSRRAPVQHGPIPVPSPAPSPRASALRVVPSLSQTTLIPPSQTRIPAELPPSSAPFQNIRTRSMTDSSRTSSHRLLSGNFHQDQSWNRPSTTAEDISMMKFQAKRQILETERQNREHEEWKQKVLGRPPPQSSISMRTPSPMGYQEEMSENKTKPFRKEISFSDFETRASHKASSASESRLKSAMKRKELPPPWSYEIKSSSSESDHSMPGKRPRRAFGSISLSIKSWENLRSQLFQNFGTNETSDKEDKEKKNFKDRVKKEGQDESNKNKKESDKILEKENPPTQKMADEAANSSRPISEKPTTETNAAEHSKLADHDLKAQKSDSGDADAEMDPSPIDVESAAVDRNPSDDSGAATPVTTRSADNVSFAEDYRSTSSAAEGDKPGATSKSDLDSSELATSLSRLLGVVASSASAHSDATRLSTSDTSQTHDNRAGKARARARLPSFLVRFRKKGQSADNSYAGSTRSSAAGAPTLPLPPPAKETAERDSLTVKVLSVTLTAESSVMRRRDVCDMFVEVRWPIKWIPTRTPQRFKKPPSRLPVLEIDYQMVLPLGPKSNPAGRRELAASLRRSHRQRPNIEILLCGFSSEDIDGPPETLGKAIVLLDKLLHDGGDLHTEYLPLMTADGHEEVGYVAVNVIGFDVLRRLRDERSRSPRHSKT